MSTTTRAGSVTVDSVYRKAGKGPDGKALWARTDRLRLRWRDPDGGERQETLPQGSTRWNAKVRATEIEHQINTRRHVPRAHVTLQEFWGRWVAEYGSMQVRRKTLHGYEANWRRYVEPHLGNIEVQALTEDHISEWHAALRRQANARTGQPLSNRTIVHMHRQLHGVLEYARKKRVARENVTEDVDPPKARKKEIAFLSWEESHRLLESARQTPWHDIIYLTLATGMRRSEVCGLRWRDVNLDAATISISRVLHQVEGEFIYDEPKTEHSRRSIDLFPGTVEVLRERLERERGVCSTNRIRFSNDRPVFCNPEGEPIRPDSLTHALGRIADAAGLTEITLHGLRHTQASLMLQEGVPMKVVQERLGHFSIQITADLYSHVARGMQREAAQRFGEGFERSRPPAALTRSA